jgi:hypothetical protein
METTLREGSSPSLATPNFLSTLTYLKKHSMTEETPLSKDKQLELIYNEASDKSHLPIRVRQAAGIFASDGVFKNHINEELNTLSPTSTTEDVSHRDFSISSFTIVGKDNKRLPVTLWSHTNEESNSVVINMEIDVHRLLPPRSPKASISKLKIGPSLVHLDTVWQQMIKASGQQALEKSTQKARWGGLNSPSALIFYESDTMLTPQQFAEIISKATGGFLILKSSKEKPGLANKLGGLFRK